MLVDSEIAELKRVLELELQLVLATITELKNTTKPVAPDNAIGRLSRMDALEMQSVNQLKLEHQQQRHHRLKIALNRIDTDEEFGYCDLCGEMINLERLKLQPESRSCVSCLELN